MTHDVLVNFRAPNWLRLKLKAEAGKRGITLSQLIRERIEQPAPAAKSPGARLSA
tara:strand:+ start:7545 stop:7709 length:165 start_codon:yes stop_codon:yes gene_type:complete